MKKITIRRAEMYTDINYHTTEISSEQFPEILDPGFSIENASDELYEYLSECDWEFLNDRVGDPDYSYRIME